MLNVLFLIAGQMMVLVGAACWLICVVGRWRIFKKAGVEGWKALIPIYSDYVEFETFWTAKYFTYYIALTLFMLVLRFGSGAGLFAVLSFVLTIAMLWIRYCLYVQMARCFGCEKGFAIGLTLCGPIFYCILGFNQSTYCSDIVAEELRIPLINKTI